MRVWVKRGLLATAGLVGVLVVAIAVFYLTSNRRIGKRFQVNAAEFAPATDSLAAMRGQRFVVVIGKCVECHGKDLGGKVMMDDRAFGRLAAANLTPGRGGVANRYKTDADWARSIRHGVDPEGRALLFMPSHDYNPISDKDLADVIAYLKTLQPVDRELPKRRVGPVARALHLAGAFPLIPAELIDHEAARDTAPQPAVTVQYGKYLAWVGGCVGCHSTDLTGGGGPPPGAPSINPARIGNWSEEDFFNALKRGIRPDGTAIKPAMPWIYTMQMTDDEIRALWLYIRSVPPKVGKKS